MSNRPFNLEQAKAGAPLITRDGRPAKFVAHFPECLLPYQLVVMVKGCGSVGHYSSDGTSCGQVPDSPHDLFMGPRKIVKWAVVHVCQDGSLEFATRPIDTEERARQIGAANDVQRVARVEWEE